MASRGPVVMEAAPGSNGAVVMDTSGGGASALTEQESHIGQITAAMVTDGPSEVKVKYEAIAEDTSPRNSIPSHLNHVTNAFNDHCMETDDVTSKTINSLKASMESKLNSSDGDNDLAAGGSRDLDSLQKLVNEQQTELNEQLQQQQQHPLDRSKRSSNGDLSDGESFDGKIVYNPDGSAYIIEGESDLSDTESLLEMQKQEGVIVDHKGKVHSDSVPLPQIANAFYIHRNPNVLLNNYFGANLYQGGQGQSSADHKVKADAPIMHSYRVYDLRNKAAAETKPAVRPPLAEVETVPTKPILMCFICKLSFGYGKSFMAHAVGEHNMALSDDERDVMNHKNASAIIQGVGKEKEPLMSFLEPNTIKKESVTSDQAALSTMTSQVDEPSPSKVIVKEELCNGPEPDDSPVRVEPSARSPGRSPASCASPGSSSPSENHPPLSPYHQAMQNAYAGLNNALHQQQQGLASPRGCEKHPMGKAQGQDCAQCALVFNSRALGGHMTMMHSRNSCKTLKCPKCNWHYKYQETLEIHMKEKHPDNDTQCIYCITQQPHPRLARGEVYTCGYKPFRCDVCNYSTTTKGNLSIHMQSDKHINNMQELQRAQSQGGSTSEPPPPEVSMPAAPPTPQPPAAPAVQSAEHQAAIKKNKPKPTWRCDVCNYETNVARNLRIHMTSEKHTQNMILLQQNVKSMQRDMQMQMSQMTMLGQDPGQLLAMQTALASQGLPPGFPYDPSLMMISGVPPPGVPPGVPGLPPVTPPAVPQSPSDVSPHHAQAAPTSQPMDLTKAEVNGMDKTAVDAVTSPIATSAGGLDPALADTSKLFQCSICNIYGTDSLEHLHQHMQLDRSKDVTGDSTALMNGTYICNLCTYKTSLKANFQLHCKTDKHMQRMQLINHIREGGRQNEWRMKYMNLSNPIQIRCNACDFYTNSIHKLQVHIATLRHGPNATIYSHLQAAEAALGVDNKYYNCSLCNFNTRTKQSLIKHVGSARHGCLHQQKRQGRGEDNSLTTLFLAKALKEGDVVKFDEPDDVADDVADRGGEVAEAYVTDMRETSMVDARHKGGYDVTNGNASSPESIDGVSNCPYCDHSAPSEMSVRGHILSKHTQNAAQVAQALILTCEKPTPVITLSCPLCEGKYVTKEELASHLVASHNVKPDSTTKLVDMAEENAYANEQDDVDDDDSGEETTKLEQEAEALDGIILGKGLGGEDDETYRCQTCAKNFLNIDALYAHQNELGHLELKQTPRGPGYLCWRKGCNQYFKTAQALQVHFREIHVKRAAAAVSDTHVFKFRCTQCTLAFRTSENLQLHSTHHLIRAATCCSVCARTFPSLHALRSHVEAAHLDSMTDAQVQQYKVNLAASLPLGVVHAPEEVVACGSSGEDSAAKSTSSKFLAVAADNNNLPHAVNNEKLLHNNAERADDDDLEEETDEAINAEALAENSYQDPTKKYKCHRCKLAFSKQCYLSSHNKTLMHRKGDNVNYLMEKYLDPNRPHKCDVCRESFTQKNILMVHCNSVSHLHKVKQQQQLCAATTSTNPPSPAKQSPDKPFKCTVCKVAYSQSSTLDIHMRSVYHQSRAAKMQETEEKVFDDKNDQHQQLLHLTSPSVATSLLSPTTANVQDHLAAQGSDVTASTPRASTSQSSSAALPTTNETEPLKSQPILTNQTATFACARCSSVFISQESLLVHQHQCFNSTPTFSSAYRSSRFGKAAQMHRSLLESFGFELAMQFNENCINRKRQRHVKRERERKSETAADDDVTKDDDNKENKALIPELNKQTCGSCHAQFSSIWVLKSHEEEVHGTVVPPDMLEKFSESFREQWDQKQPSPEPAQVLNAGADVTSSTSSTESGAADAKPSTSTASTSASSRSNADAKRQEELLNASQADLMMLQAHMMQMPGMFGLMPGMVPGMPAMPGMSNMAAMNLQPPLVPMVMPGMPGMDPVMAGMMMPMLDPNNSGSMTPSHKVPAVSDSNQAKRGRTRINDDQLKVLRAYFDINNSPSDEQIMEMSEKSGLPHKVIKHWFRNTLFKERQRNKDSPYNFNNPPATTINIEEYEKTGELKVEKDGKVEKMDVKAPNNPRDRAAEEAARFRLANEHKLNQAHQEFLSQVDRAAAAAIVEKRVEKDSWDSAKSSSSASSSVSGITQQTASTNGGSSAATSTPSNKHNEILSALNASFPSALPTAAHNELLYHQHAASMTGAGLPTPHPASFVSPPDRRTSSDFSISPPTPGTQTSPSSSHMSKRANRTRFSDFQIKSLQDYFERNAYPKDDDLDHLSKMLNLSPRVIVVWFQNARQKARKTYENQPAHDLTDDKFTRTPGLNYQCKKCNTVFQRYYELIKHQKTQCFKDDASRGPDDYIEVKQELDTSIGGNTSAASSSKMNESQNEALPPQTPPKNNSSTPKTSPFQCEKCSLSFPRIDLWREHQSFHVLNPGLFNDYAENSAFGLLQNVAQKTQLEMEREAARDAGEARNFAQQEDMRSRVFADSPLKRSHDETEVIEDYDSDQPKDKRLRTTILPEQLDYLYQKYQLDCNPSRKQLESIASDVGLKKRVVQVWFQNTRARERKGQYRAHQQLIHKRCPFCRALFRAKTALESHLASKHPEEMAKGDINVDQIPEEPIPPPNQQQHKDDELDFAKMMTAQHAIPQSMMMPPPMLGGAAAGDPLQAKMKKMYDDSLKVYLDQLSGASHQGAPRASAARGEETPLDLSKNMSSSRSSGSIDDGSGELDRRQSLDAESETHSESTDNQDVNDESQPPSPSTSTTSSASTTRIPPLSTTTTSNSAGAALSTSSSLALTPGKRYRTQMSNAQIRVMKLLFNDYKTPTMAECDMLGREIGLAKRVVQVWFQNARAKEKKAKLTMSKTFGTESVDFSRPPEECRFCNFKYSHKYTVQDHVFTKKHIDMVRTHVSRQGDDTTPTTPREGHSPAAQPPDASLTAHPHLAQLHAMGLQAMQDVPEVKVKDKQASPAKKEEPKKSSSKEVAAPAASSAQSAAPGLPPGMMPGMMDPAMLQYMAGYTGMGGVPGMPAMPGMPPMLPGMMPGAESMFMYDPALYGTPLNMLQIPPQAIQQVSLRMAEPGLQVTYYSQDCNDMKQLMTQLEAQERRHAVEAKVDVGYICKNCHMVYPGRDACVSHQMSVCCPGKSAKELEQTILKLEQLQYECGLCEKRYSTIHDIKAHFAGDRHKAKAAAAT